MAEPDEPETYRTFDQPLAVAMAGLVHADGVIVAGTACEDGEFGLTIIYSVDGELLPAVMVKGKVADDLLSLATQAQEAAKRAQN